VLGFGFGHVSTAGRKRRMKCAGGTRLYGTVYMGLKKRRKNLM
jgi:hypothetical protein